MYLPPTDMASTESDRTSQTVGHVTHAFSVLVMMLSCLHGRLLTSGSSDEAVSIISGWSWTKINTFSMGDRSGLLARHTPFSL